MKRILVLSLSICFSCILNGQDLHFSQYFTNQQIQNPALTGLYKNDFSISGIYRTQWNQIDAKFENFAFSGDAKIPFGQGKLGIGGLILRDVLPAARYSVTTAMLSGAYHYYLDYPEKHLLSIGTQIGWTAKSFLPGSDLEFGNQYANYQFDANLPDFENLQDATINSININAGANYKARLNYRSKLSVGVNFNSLSTPDNSFISDKNTNQLGIRYLSYVMLDFDLNNKLIISPKILYTNQSRGEDITFGALGTLKFKNCTYAQLGSFYRWEDSGILILGFGWQSYLLRASVDLTTSSLNQVGKIQDSGYRSPKAYEIGFIYTGIFKKHELPNLTVPCGIF